MDPKHRDRVAFVRLCSGRFQRGMKLTHGRAPASRSRSHSPMFFFAHEREIAEEAWAGDIIGIPNHGQLRIGDALTEGEALRFTGIPNFAPEILMRRAARRPDEGEASRQALEDLAEEGVAQVFRPGSAPSGSSASSGQLQLDVLQTRLDAEYSLPIGFEAAPYVTARWCAAGDREGTRRFREAKRASLANDRDGNPVYLARNNWDLGRVQEDFPQIRFTATRERH